MAGLAKLNGIALANIAKFSGLAKANAAKINGITVPVSGGGIAFLSATAKGAASGSADVTTDAIDTTGATLIVLHLAYYYLATPTITDSQGNTWTELPLYNSSLYRIACYYCLSPSTSASHTFTVATGGYSLYASLSSMAFSGVTSYDSRESGSTATGTSLQPGSETPSANGALIVTALDLNGTGTSISVDSGFTNRATVAYSSGVHFGLNAASYVQPTAAAINPTWSWANSLLSLSNMAVFK